MAVADGACDDIDDVLALIRAIPGQPPLLAVQLGPVVGSHTGPNTVGVCYIVPTSAAPLDD